MPATILSVDSEMGTIPKQSGTMDLPKPVYGGDLTLAGSHQFNQFMPTNTATVTWRKRF